MERALQHIAEAEEVTERIGKPAIDELQEIFLSMTNSQYPKFLSIYRAQYGYSAADYLHEEGYSLWRSRQRKMSGLVLKRILNLVPRIMTTEQKAHIADLIYEYHWPHSSETSQYISLNKQTDLNELLDQLTEWYQCELSQLQDDAETAIENILYNIQGLTWLTNSEIYTQHIQKTKFIEKKIFLMKARFEGICKGFHEYISDYTTNAKVTGTTVLYRMRITVEIEQLMLPPLADPLPQELESAIDEEIAELKTDKQTEKPIYVSPISLSPKKTEDDIAFFRACITGLFICFAVIGLSLLK